MNCLQPWTSPLLRWAGCKRKLLPTLMSHVPAGFSRYVEPFAGSACLFFALRPARAVLGETNYELIEAYSTIRSHPRRVARRVAKWNKIERQYYAVRRLSPPDLSLIDRAARFVYLNRFCFNGVYRTNRQGQFNVPRGKHTGKVPDEAAFYRCSVALRNADLRPVDFADCLNDVSRHDFVYLDPPYATTTRIRYGEYGYHCFGEGDIERLVCSLSHIDDVGAVFLLSYSDTSRLTRRLRRWHCMKLLVPRSKNGPRSLTIC